MLQAKVAILGTYDLYHAPGKLFKLLSASGVMLPNIEFGDMVSLMENPSPYTLENMAHKNMDSFKYFRAGLVNVCL